MGIFDSAREQAEQVREQHEGIDGPGVPETARAAAGPTQATTSGGGPAPAAGQDETHAGLADSVGESEGVAQEAAEAGLSAPAGEPGANGGMSSELDPVTDLAEELGLAPRATDALDPGQDNGLNS